MKRFIGMLCAFALCIGLCGTAFATKATDFTDVKKGQWYFDAVNYTVDKKMFNGTSATKFSPNTKMNRGMFVTVLSRYAGTKDKNLTPIGTVISETVNLRDKPTTEGSKVLTSVKKGTRLYVLSTVKDSHDKSHSWYEIKLTKGSAYVRDDLMTIEDTDGFTDVKGNEYYACHIKWAVDNKIATPIKDKQFKPLQDITREDICGMMYNFLNYTNVSLKPSVEAKSFTDKSKISAKNKAAVELMQKCGIVSGYTDGSFGPQKGASRAEVATMLYRFISQYEAQKSGDGTDNKALSDFIKAKGITRNDTMGAGNDAVKIAHCAQFVYNCLTAVGTDFYTPYTYNEAYFNNMTDAQIKLSTSGILDVKGNIPQLNTLESLILASNLAMYRDSEMYGNESDYVTGKMLKSYYELIYPTYKKYANNSDEIIAPDKLLSRIGMTERDIVTRESFSKMFIALREASTGYKVDLSNYNPTYRIVDIENIDEMKMLHKLNVFESGQAFYLHPERKLNMFEFKPLFSRMISMSDCFTNDKSVAYYPSSDDVFNLLAAVYKQKSWTDVPDKEKINISNDSDPSSYLSQFDGSKYENANCGPTSAAMIYNWYSGQDTYNGASVCETSCYPNGNWTSHHIQSWLEDMNVTLSFAPNRIYDLKLALDRGALVQVMIDNGKSRHALVASGYKIHGNDMWFELMDPSGNGMGNSINSNYTYIYSSVLDYDMSVRSDRLIIVNK